MMDVVVLMSVQNATQAMSRAGSDELVHDKVDGTGILQTYMIVAHYETKRAILT